MRSPRKLADEITKIRNQGFRYVDHPFVLRLRQGKASREEIRAWARQMYLVLNHTGRSNGYMHANCPNPVVRSRLAGVIADEELSDQCGSDSHINLHAKFCRALGITDEELQREKLIPAVKTGLEWLMETRRNNPPALAVSR
jgi:pyrroloquinoline quinone (PQQ) biosynthesis protein C